MNRIKRLVCFIISLCIITGLAVSQSAPAEASAKQASIKKLALSDLDKNADDDPAEAEIEPRENEGGQEHDAAPGDDALLLRLALLRVQPPPEKLRAAQHHHHAGAEHGREEDDEQYYATVIAVVKYDAATNTISDVLYTEEPKNDYAVNSSGQVMIYDRKERAFIIYDKKGYHSRMHVNIKKLK